MTGGVSFLRTLFCFMLGGAFLLAAASSPAQAQAPDCLKCHGKLIKGQVVHAAVEMGCATCHSGIDASMVPHKKTTSAARGLSADQPDLCYGCHEKTGFDRKNVHAAVSMGCTGCHDPHSSGKVKLLKAEAPELCYSCHDRKVFTKKTVHAPVAGGMCLSCHSPHASDEMALLVKEPYDTCLECHGEVVKKAHAVSGLSANSHPVKPTKKGRTRQKGEWVEVTVRHKDPARPDKPFYCGSCHDPHSTDGPRLYRFNAKSTMELCAQCHKM